MNLESFTEREKEKEARQTSALILRLKKSSLGRAVMVNNLNFYYLIRSYFYTNGAEALVFVSMMSRRNIRSWTGAWLFPSLSGRERWQTRTDYSDIWGGQKEGWEIKRMKKRKRRPISKRAAASHQYHQSIRNNMMSGWLWNPLMQHAGHACISATFVKTAVWWGNQ